VSYFIGILDFCRYLRILNFYCLILPSFDLFIQGTTFKVQMNVINNILSH